MVASLDKLIADALALPLREREQLLDRLLESIDPGEDAPLSEAWVAELKRRQQAVADGAETFDAQDVFAKLRRERA